MGVTTIHPAAPASMSGKAAVEDAIDWVTQPDVGVIPIQFGTAANVVASFDRPADTRRSSLRRQLIFVRSHPESYWFDLVVLGTFQFGSKSDPSEAQVLMAKLLRTRTQLRYDKVSKPSRSGSSSYRA